MLIHLFTILMLLMQPLALLEVNGHNAGGQAHTDCCAVVVRTACCEEEAVELDCNSPSGSCLCQATPGDTPEVPWAPSRDSFGSMSLAARSGVGFMRLLLVDEELARVPGFISIRGSHGQTRALLCDWRT
jgi:hypothetical protein